jgi:hypothetical protein
VRGAAAPGTENGALTGDGGDGGGAGHHDEGGQEGSDTASVTTRHEKLLCHGQS